MSDKKRNSDDNNFKSNLKNVLISSGTGTLLLIVLTLLMSAVFVKVDTTDNTMTGIMFAVAVVPALVGGYVSGKLAKKQGAINGIFSAIGEIIMVCILLFATCHNIGLKTIAFAVVTIIFSVIGGIMAVNKRVKRKI